MRKDPTEQGRGKEVALMFEEEIEAGVALLDGIKPQWYHHVDLDALNLNNCHHCVIGQLFGEFTHGVIKVRAHGRWDPFDDDWDFAYAYGFAVPDEDDPDIEEKYAMLTHEWRKTIIRLREERHHGHKPEQG